MATAAPQRTRIDWSAARAFYVSLPLTERSFRCVAREFKVSEQTVAKHVRREGWLEAAAEADRRAGAKALEQSMRTREERAVQTARIRDLAADRVERILTPNDAGQIDADHSTVAAAWKEADRQYRLDIGEVTDRISIPEVREFVLRLAGSVDELLVAVLDESLANGKRQVVLRAFRARFPEVLEETAGTVAVEART